jgi:ribosomal protein S18 acetylase RimI-like enzyme
MNALRIEEQSLNAWPALETYLYDGWLLRFSNGYTKRANSVNALYPGILPLDEKIAFCETQYRERGLLPTFRLTDFAQSAELDAELARHGYRRFDETSVQVLDLSWSGAMGSERAYMLPDRSGLESWLGTFHALNPARRNVATHAQLLAKAFGRKCPMVLMAGDETVACGLGISDNGYFGLFDIVTDAAQRRKGYGRELTESLIAWGIQDYAHTAYLQVMTDNEPALALYAQLGFKELYRYGYRVPQK